MKRLVLSAALTLGVYAMLADTTIYVTGPCAVTLSGTPTPTPTPTVVVTPTPTRTPTATPTPSLSPIAQTQALMMIRFPKYDSDGALLTNPVYYSFGDCLAPIQQALASQTPVQVTQALGTIWSKYATTYVPPGPGGPGGQSCSLAWGQATGEAGYSQCKAALFPPGITPVPTPK